MLSPVNARDVVRCDHCSLTQFVLPNNLCRRCHRDLDEEPETEATALAPPPAMPQPSVINVAGAVRSWRHAKGLSQRALAKRMGLPRTYCSKVETAKTTPTLASLARLAEALEITVIELLDDAEAGRREAMANLMKDGYVAEIASYVARLNALQRDRVLVEMQRLVETRSRRIA